MNLYKGGAVTPLDGFRKGKGGGENNEKTPEATENLQVGATGERGKTGCLTQRGKKKQFLTKRNDKIRKKNKALEKKKILGEMVDCGRQKSLAGQKFLGGGGKNRGKKSSWHRLCTAHKIEKRGWGRGLWGPLIMATAGKTETTPDIRGTHRPFQVTRKRELVRLVILKQQRA